MSRSVSSVTLLVVVLLIASPTSPGVQGQAQLPATSPVLWLTPPPNAPGANSPVAVAVAQLADGKAAIALPALMKAAQDPLIGGYARLYAARAQMALGKPALATELVRQILALEPDGYLNEAALGIGAEAAETQASWSEAVWFLRALANLRPFNIEDVQMRLGRAALEFHDLPLARISFARVYYDYPLSAEATDAATELARLTRGLTPGPETTLLELARAHKLFAARRFADARKAYEPLRAAAGDERPLLELRLAECDLQLKKYAAARDALRPFVERAGPLQHEAQYYYLIALRELGRDSEYVTLTQAYVEAYPDRALAEQALNDLGTYYIVKNEDGQAARVFADLYRRFPAGAFSERAAWKAGWWAYKNGEYRETLRLFENAASTMRRADTRPAWLYWAARSHASLGEHSLAVSGFQQVVADYRNSYYGRQASRVLEEMMKKGPVTRGAAGPSATAPATTSTSATTRAPIVPGDPPPNAEVIRALLASGLYDDAINELRRVQAARGTSPLLDATLAFALNKRGELRPAVTAMRRAYPQFMAQGGEALPSPILRVIFPLDYWDLIRRQATSHKLDPYLMAALVAQESTFDADIRSAANAWGLMQIIPATGRRYAQMLGIRPFRTARLTEPETNVRIGMAYFADLVDRFKDPAPALAAYNAGEQRVSRWLAERPGVDRDEFIDDIPFPETQNYVKRIIGTAEDYRSLYR